MAFKIDYSRLMTTETDAQRTERFAREDALQAVAKAASRRAEITATLQVTMVGSPETRLLLCGTPVVWIRFREMHQATVKAATWEAPNQDAADAFTDLPEVAATWDAGDSTEGPRVIRRATLAHPQPRCRQRSGLSSKSLVKHHSVDHGKLQTAEPFPKGDQTNRLLRRAGPLC